MSQPNNQNQSHSINQRVARPKGDPMCAQGGILAGWFKTIHTWVPHLFEIMSDGIGEARRQQLRCLKWISIWRGDLLSIHYTRSIISRSDAVIHWYHQTLFKKEMEPRGEFFVKNHPAKILPWEHKGEPLPLDSQAQHLGFYERFGNCPGQLIGSYAIKWVLTTY